MNRQSCLSIIALTLLSALAPAGAEPLPEPLAEIARLNRYPIHVADRSVAGEGGERLLAEARAADIFMFGENHGIREIAALADALYRDLGPRRLVTEVSPLTAVEIETLLCTGTYAEFLDDGVNVHAVPFFSLAEEIPLLDSVLARRPEGERAIYGLDQEFMAAAPLVLGWLERVAVTEMERDAVSAAWRASLLNPFLVGMGSGEALRDLQAAFSQSSNAVARRVTEGLVISHKIYKEQMGGDAAWSNERRETLMMENFLADVAAIADPPPLFMKFGSFHLFLGEGPSVEEPLGLRVARWAEARDLSVLNMFTDCSGGEMFEPLFGGTQPCDTYLAGKADGFSGLVIDNGPTLFDLRPLRGHPELENAHPRVRRVVNGFAWLLLIPDAHASAYMPGTLVTHRYGLIAGVLLLIVIAALVLLIRRGWRRWRRRHVSA